MCYVYFIQKGYGSIKIGSSTNPENRLSQLQTGNHAKLYLICKIPFDTRKEAEYFEDFLHELFKNWRLEGEWFKRCILRKIPKRSTFFPHIFDGGKIKGYLEKETPVVEITEQMTQALKAKHNHYNK